MPLSRTPDPEDSRLADELAASVREVRWSAPALPAQTTAILRTCLQGSVDSRTVSAMLGRDPELSRKILRIANSAMWTPSEPIQTLHGAVSRLGDGVVAGISIVTALRHSLFEPSGHEHRFQGLWAHSLLVSAWAVEIARLRHANVQTAFLTALLHDIGKPILASEIESLAARAGVDFGMRDMESWMTEHHARVGSDCVRLWKFPAPMDETIARHHECAREEGYVEDAYALGVADRLAHLMVGGGRMDEWTVLKRMRNHLGLELFGLRGRRLVRLLERREEVMAAAQAFA